jgi:hypothetical protein
MGQSLDTLLQQWGTYRDMVQGDVVIVARYGMRLEETHRILPNLERGMYCSWNGFWRKDMEDESCDG